MERRARCEPDAAGGADQEARPWGTAAKQVPCVKAAGHRRPLILAPLAIDTSDAPDPPHAAPLPAGQRGLPGDAAAPPTKPPPRDRLTPELHKQLDAMTKGIK